MTIAPEAPLLETFARVRGVNEYLRVRIGEFDTLAGCSMSAILDPAHGVLDEHLAAMAKSYKTENLDVLARFYFNGFAYYLASAVIGPFVLERRVPVLAQDALAVTIGSWGSPDGIILRQPAFYCLPDDPAAEHGDARLVPDIDALRRRLREDLVRVCEPLIAAVRRRAKVGTRAMWITVAETCAGLLVDALPAETVEAAAHEEVEALIGREESALRAKPEIIRLVVGGQCAFVLLGSDCCFNFKLEGESYCETCPHRPREERLAALQARISGRAAGKEDA